MLQLIADGIEPMALNSLVAELALGGLTPIDEGGTTSGRCRGVPRERSAGTGAPRAGGA